jgi:hypothetical protein
VLSETLPAPTVTVFVVEAVLLATAVLAVVRMPLPPRAAKAGDTAKAGRAAWAAQAGPAGQAGRTGRAGRTGAPARAAWIRIPAVPGGGLQLALGIAVFAPGITATSFVLSLGPSLLSGLLGTTSRIVAGAMAFAMFLTATGVQFAVQRLRRRTILTAGAVSMGQLGGLSLLNSTVPAHRLAEANAALNVGGYVPAGILPVSAGYLSDAVGLTDGATVFGLALLALAVAGGLVVTANRRRVPESG